MALREYFNVNFWFYESAERTRGSWWRVEGEGDCEVLSGVWFLRSGILRERYWASGLSKRLRHFSPDVVILGGFSQPANVWAYWWARRHRCKTVVFTERSRTSAGKLRTWGVAWRILRYVYRNVDLVVTSAEDIVPQFRDDFRFGDKVVAGRYAADLDGYFHHPIRVAKDGYTYLFANRLTEIYNPILAIEIFAAVCHKYPESKLVMNASGELRDRCVKKIEELGVGEMVEFLDCINSWEELPGVYARCDILLLPASFSNGNFTILEAMASGMGVVISDKVLGVGKSVRDGVNGFRCEPNVKDFVERIARYISDPNEFLRHARHNRELVADLGARGTARFFFELLTERVLDHHGVELE
jgi:glycosyltransferase involved in cell wall biosynthesis